MAREIGANVEPRAFQIPLNPRRVGLTFACSVAGPQCGEPTDGSPLRSLRPLGPMGPQCARCDPPGVPSAPCSSLSGAEPPPTRSAALLGGAAVGDLARMKTSPDLEPQVVFLGLPIPPLTDKEPPPRSGSGYQNSARHVMQQSAAAGSDPPQRHRALPPSALSTRAPWHASKIPVENSQSRLQSRSFDE